MGDEPERARKVSNVHGEVHFKQKQRLTIVFTVNTLPHRQLSCKGTEDFTEAKIDQNIYGNTSQQKLAPQRNQNKIIIIIITINKQTNK